MRIEEAKEATDAPRRRPGKVRADLKTKAWRSIRMLVLQRDGYVCQACHKRPPEVRRLVVDHRVPPERGGELYAEANLWVLCSGCNYSKGRRTVEEWYSEKAGPATPEEAGFHDAGYGSRWQPLVIRDYSKRR
jgi:hypothetical protein